MVSKCVWCCVVRPFAIRPLPPLCTFSYRLHFTLATQTELARAQFAWAPPGRGIDSHRAWECLLAGCVPIVLRTTLAPLYAGMAVLQVDDYSRLTAQELRRAAQLAAQAPEDSASGLAPQLYAFYWLALIEQTAAAKSR